MFTNCYQNRILTLQKKGTKELRENDRNSAFVSYYKNCDILFFIMIT